MPAEEAACVVSPVHGLARPLEPASPQVQRLLRLVVLIPFEDVHNILYRGSVPFGCLFRPYLPIAMSVQVVEHLPGPFP